MARPRLLDLFCGAGGASMGYYRAGWEVYGVDIVPQPNYPFFFKKADAMEVNLDGFDAIHASPPCQGYSTLAVKTTKVYPKLIVPVRERLQATGVPYIIENVEGAPLVDPIVLCGTMFPPLRVLRHRLFECSEKLWVPEHPEHPLVFTHDKRQNHYGKLDQDTSFVQVTGGGNSTIENARDAMGIGWMEKKLEINESIPPAYTEFIGAQVLDALEAKVA